MAVLGEDSGVPPADSSVVIHSEEQKHKRCKVGKNRKKSWRKFSNIKDVEDYLEEKREDERMGGHPSEKSNESLFFVEKKPSLKAESFTVLSKKARRSRPLKCLQGLLPSSLVPAITVPRAPLSTKSKKEWSEKRKRSAASEEIQHENKKAKKDPKAGNNVYDLWDSPNTEEQDDVDKEIVEHFVRSTCKKPAVVPDHIYMKPSLLPSVEVPHPGASYNPDFEDYQSLLKEAHEIEVKKEKEENRIERKMAKKLIAMDLEEIWLKEMSQGLGTEEEPEKSKDIDANEPPSKTNTQQQQEKLTKLERKKKKKRELERKRKEMEMKKKREELLKMNDVYRLKSIKRGIAKDDEKSAARQQKKKAKIIESMYQPKKLSKYKYEAPDVEIKLSDELTGSLRLLKAEGNILEDRYKSLQRRNLIEPRVKQKMKRKYSLKTYVKRSHRD